MEEPRGVNKLCASPDGLQQRMSGVLEGYGMDPRKLSPQQLYRLALILQLIQAEDRTGGPRPQCIIHRLHYYM